MKRNFKSRGGATGDFAEGSFAGWISSCGDTVSGDPFVCFTDGESTFCILYEDDFVKVARAFRHSVTSAEDAYKALASHAGSKRKKSTLTFEHRADANAPEGRWINLA